MGTRLERGETPFLHVLASNTGAVRLYEKPGFRLRLSTELLIVTHSEAA